MRLPKSVCGLLCILTAPALLVAKTFDLSKASIADIHAAVDAGALSYEKLMALYLARIEAYDQKGPALNSIILVSPTALAEAKAADEEYKSKGRRSLLHGIPILVKDNFDTIGLPNTGGSFLLEGNISKTDAPMIKGLRDAGGIMIAKTNLDEFAAGGIGFSSFGGQTLNPHDLKRVPAGSSGGTGAALAAWFAPLGLGTDTGGSIRGPSFANGVPGIKPTTGLLSRSGIIPRVLSFDTGGPMARTVEDMAISLGFMTGVDPTDPLTLESAGLYYKDYTPFLQRGSLKGARVGIIRDLMGLDTDVDAVYNAAVEDMRKLGAVVVDPINFPVHVMQSRAAIMEIVRDSDVREQYNIYLPTLAPGFPKTLTEMIERADAFTTPRGKIVPYPALYDRFRVHDAGPPSMSLMYQSAKNEGMAMVRKAVIGLMELHDLDAIVYVTRPTRPALIDPNAPRVGSTPSAQSLTNIMNVARLPDIIVPAGATPDKLPVTISFVGHPYSEPKLLGYAYDYEQATEKLILPSTTPALPGEVFNY